jgi:hypothetical protein
MKHNFDFDLKVDKKDILTMVLLSLIFFSIAVTNLGATSVPSNSLTVNSTEPQAAVIDLGNSTYVNKICFYMKDCQNTCTIKIYTDQPGNWIENGKIIAGYPFAYMNWNETNITKQQDTSS